MSRGQASGQAGAETAECHFGLGPRSGICRYKFVRASNLILRTEYGVRSIDLIVRWNDRPTYDVTTDGPVRGRDGKGRRCGVSHVLIAKQTLSTPPLY